MLLAAAELALLPLTLGLTLACLLIDRLTRWRPGWLAGPGVIGLAWTLAMTAGTAATAYSRWAMIVFAALGSAGPRHLGTAIVGLVRLWPGRQGAGASLALMVAAAQAFLIDLMIGGVRGGWPRRRGLVATVRGGCVRFVMRRGELATRDGGSVGIVPGTGARMAVAWAQAAHGMLLAGRDPAAVHAAGEDLALAGIAHRKTVIVVELNQAARRSGPAPEAMRLRSARDAPVDPAGSPLAGFADPRGRSSGPAPTPVRRYVSSPPRGAGMSRSR